MQVHKLQKVKKVLVAVNCLESRVAGSRGTRVSKNYSYYNTGKEQKTIFRSCCSPQKFDPRVNKLNLTIFKAA